MKIKLFIVVIALACMLLLVSCAPKETPAVTTQKDAASSTQAATASTTQETGERPSLLTNDNVTLPGEIPICEEMETLTVALIPVASVLSFDYEENFQTKWMQDRSNVQVILEQFPADGAQKLELMISSGAELPDIIYGVTNMGIDKDAVRFKYGKSGAIIPLNEYYDQLAYYFDQTLNTCADYGDFLTKEEMFACTVSPDGNLYGMIDYRPTFSYGYSHRGWFNNKWLEALNLEEPTTTEELVEVLRAFRDEDPNGNGKQDEIPMVGANTGWRSNPIELLMNQFIYCCGSSLTDAATGYYYIADDGIIDVPFDKEEWREGLRFIKSLVDDELLSTLSFTQDYAQYNALMSADVETIGVGVSGSCSGFGNNKIDYTPLGAITGPNGLEIATYTPRIPTVVAVITKDCESPDLAFRWLDLGYDNTSEYPLIQHYGEPDVDWRYIDGGISFYPMYDATYEILINIWGTAQQKIWCEAPWPVLAYSAIMESALFNGDESYNEYRNSLGINKVMDYAPAKEDLVPKIVYTEEENEQYDDIRTTLVGYVRESMVLFVMGELDLDKDWEDYLNELEVLQYEELMAIDQAAYNRTIGK